MRTWKILHLSTMALLAVGVLTACGTESVHPLPVQAASADPTGAAPSTSATAAHSPPAVQPDIVRQPVRTQPTRTRTPAVRPAGSAPPRSCYGAIRFDVDLRNTVLDLMKSMCFRTGAVLRLQGIGPGLVTATPTSLVSQSYEAGVVDVRFVRPGTVTVTIPMEEQTHTITVVVIS